MSLPPTSSMGSQAPRPQRPPLPARAAVGLAIFLNGPALLLVVRGNLDVSTAAMRFVVALTVSVVVLRLVGTALHASTGDETRTDPSGPEVFAGRRSGDPHPGESGEERLPEGLLAP
jgi:hypothetical protein